MLLQLNCIFWWNVPITAVIVRLKIFFIDFLVGIGITSHILKRPHKLFFCMQFLLTVVTRLIGLMQSATCTLAGAAVVKLAMTLVVCTYLYTCIILPFSEILVPLFIPFCTAYLNSSQPLSPNTSWKLLLKAYVLCACFSIPLWQLLICCKNLLWLLTNCSIIELFLTYFKR